MWIEKGKVPLCDVNSGFIYLELGVFVHSHSQLSCVGQEERVHDLYCELILYYSATYCWPMGSSDIHNVVYCSF